MRGFTSFEVPLSTIFLGEVVDVMMIYIIHVLRVSQMLDVFLLEMRFEVVIIKRLATPPSL